MMADMVVATRVDMAVATRVDMATLVGMADLHQT